MGESGTFFRQRAFWAGCVAVVAPLALLLGLQYVWLDRLARMTAEAQAAALVNFLETVVEKTEYFYRSAAERTLNVTTSPFVQGRLDQVAAHWRNRPLEGIRRLFLVDYTRERFGNLFVYDPDRQALVPASISDETLAIIVACTPWQTQAFLSARTSLTGLSVDERNPEHRIVLNPIADEEAMVVGIAGMILDETYARERLLPGLIEKAGAAFFRGVDPAELLVSVRGATGAPVIGSETGAARHGAVETRRFRFVLSGWSVGLRGPSRTPEQWARASFAFNMTLAALLAVAVTGGIAFTLRAAGRAVRLSEMKSDFVSNVSHELRTPLASIRTFAELLRLGKVPPEKTRDYGAHIEAESRRLTRLVDNLLDFARIESGRKTYRFVSADVRRVAEAALGSFTAYVNPQGFRFSIAAPEEPLPPATVDPDALGQALHNLLENAVKYSGDAREVALRLRRDGEDLVIAVEDHGIGIPTDEQRRIFDRFHRVGTSLVHEVKGTGLGLSIVDHIVRAHGGTVSVESEPGRGSTFAIRLPIQGPPGRAAA